MVGFTGFQSGVFSIAAKGQKKPKWFFQVEVSSKKQTNEFYFTAMKPQVDLFSFFRFLEEIEDTKKTFQNYLTFIENPLDGKLVKCVAK